VSTSDPYADSAALVEMARAMVDDYVRAAFATGYAEAGPVPVPVEARAAVMALAGVISGDPDRIASVVAEGRTEGRRAALRQRRQVMLDDQREAQLPHVAHLASLIDAAALVTLLASAVSRAERRALAMAEMTAALFSVHGLAMSWMRANTQAYVVASAEGRAEYAAAVAGPPDPASVARAVDLAAVPAALATEAGVNWTTLQVGGLAGDLAGPALTSEEIIRATLADAVGPGYYLEESMIETLWASWKAAASDQVDFVMSDSHDQDDECDSAALSSPYSPADAPDIPLHAQCRCELERTIEN